jgi:hypothetical protein
MDLLIDKFISNLYRPGLVSSGLNNTLGKARELMVYFNLSQEDLEAAGIILADPGRAGKDVYPPGAPANYQSGGEKD